MFIAKLIVLMFVAIMCWMGHFDSEAYLGLPFIFCMGQVAGTGFYPTNAQAAQNYMNVVRKNFTPTLVYQNLRKAKPFLRYVLEKCARERTGGFSPITQPITMSTFGTDGAYSDWSGRFQIPSITNPIVNAEWNQALYVQPIAFTMPELSLMQGVGNEFVVIDVIKARLYDKYQSVLDMLSAAFLGTASGSATPTLAFNGLTDGIDDGTNAPTYGNVPRAANPLWNSTIYANTQQAQANYLQVLYYIMSFLQDTNNPMPSMALVSYQVFYALITSFTNIEQMIVQDINAIARERGYDIAALDIGGIPHVVDPNITGTTGYYPNMQHWFFDYNTDFNFKMTELSPLLPIGQLGWIQALTVAGQFYTDLPSGSMAVTGMPSTTLA